MIENNIANVRKIIKGKVVQDVVAEPARLKFIYTDGTTLTIESYSYLIDINEPTKKQ